MISNFSLKEQTFFFKRLAFLINASVPLLDGLSVLREQALTRSHRRVLDQIIADVSQGQSLSRSFSKFPRVFNEFSVSIVKVGEQSGTLSHNLEYLSEELKKKQMLRRKVVGAFIYPALITFATLGITGFLMLYLFPKIAPIFSSMHMDLPLTTQLVMALSNFFQAWGVTLLVSGIVLAIVATFLLKRFRTLHKLFDRAAMRLPLVGKVMQYYNMSNMARTLGLLLKSGIKLSDALPITADATTNLVYKAHLVAVAGGVMRGARVSVYLKAHRRHFPDIMTHMVAVGEQSGTLSETLLYLADYYDHEVDEFTKNLSTLIEPALMIFMGVLVGFIAISIITPIYGITQNLHG